jgi:hypothetical protein
MRTDGMTRTTRMVDDREEHEERRSRAWWDAHQCRSEVIGSQADVRARVLAGEVERASETESKTNSTVGLLDGWNKLS